ncbi:MAG: polyprenyl synthetase family protein, partial [Alphaproteobacteria bacterium]
VRETGKAVGKDETHGKATLVTVLGIAGARAEADRLCERAVEALDIFGPRADLLRAAARFIAERRA